MCTKNQLEEIINKIVLFSKDLFEDNFKNVILYGSYSRGVMNNFCTELDLQYNVLLSPKIQSLSFFNQWKNTLPFYKNVVKDGVMYA